MGQRGVPGLCDWFIHILCERGFTINAYVGFECERGRVDSGVQGHLPISPSCRTPCSIGDFIDDWVGCQQSLYIEQL